MVKNLNESDKFSTGDITIALRCLLSLVLLTILLILGWRTAFWSILAMCAYSESVMQLRYIAICIREKK